VQLRSTQHGDGVSESVQAPSKKRQPSDACIYLGFYLNLPAAAVVAAILVMTEIPERPAQVEKPLLRIVLSELDLSGFVIFAPAAIMFLLGLEYGGREHPWKSATVIGLLLGSGGAFAVFFAWEYRQGDRAMIPFSMLRRREVWTSMLVGTFIMGTVFVFSFYLPVYFQAVKGVSPFTSGVYVLPNILTSTFFAVLSGSLGKLYSSPRTNWNLTPSHSQQNRLLHSVGPLRWHPNHHRQRPLRNPHPLNNNRTMGRISDSPWSARCRPTNGKPIHHPQRHFR